MSTIMYLFSVTVAHYIVGNLSAFYYKRLINHASVGAKIFHRMVVKANIGRFIYHVLLGSITSIDDTIIFVFRGASTSLHASYLLDNASNGKKSSRFCNDTGGIDHLNI